MTTAQQTDYGCGILRVTSRHVTVQQRQNVGRIYTNVQIDWLKEPWTRESAQDAVEADSNTVAVPTIIAAGKATMIADRRYRVYRPHNSALSVLIIRRAKKHDAGVYRCNLSGSSTRQKYLVLNVTGLSLFTDID